MFLERIEITQMSLCLANPEWIRVIAEMSIDISELMPYLNAVIKNATYVNEGKTLTFTKEGRLITLYPRRIAMLKVRNITDAWQVLDWIKNTINEIYENRDRITPSYERRMEIKALDIYRWLPRKNCKECGEATCLAFAVKLLSGEQKIENCHLLFKPEYSELKRQMLEIGRALGYEVPPEE